MYIIAVFGDFLYFFSSLVKVVTNRDTLDTLLCLAYVFEICMIDDGPKHRVYRLVKDS